MSTANKSAMCKLTRDAKSPAGLCPFQRSDIGIIPVRYALDDMDERRVQMHPFPATDTQWKGRFTPKQRQYTLRQLRDGWLYVYDETGNPVYRLDLAGTTKDSITVFISLPFNWQASEHEKLGYIASCNSQGELVISPAFKESSIRTINVDVN